MDESQQGNGHMHLAWLAALLATAIGVHWSQKPLTSTRPDVKPWSSTQRFGDQPIEARLWQDPIAAIAGDDYRPEWGQGTLNPKPKVAKICASELRSGIEKRMMSQNAVGDLSPSKNVSILIVPTNTRRYAEDAENRRRERFAVISALAVANLAPENAAGIGCLQIPWKVFDGEISDANTGSVLATMKEGTLSPGRVSRSDPPDGPSLDVPFEWFRRKIHSYYSPLDVRLESADPPDLQHGLPTNVLVLWLDEEVLQSNPLFRLAKVVEFLRGNPDFPVIWDTGQKAQPRIYYLGPTTSTFLRTMLPWKSVDGNLVQVGGRKLPSPWHELDHRCEQEIERSLHEVVFHSWGTMLPDELLLKEMPDRPECGGNCSFGGAHHHFAHELKKKGPTLRSPLYTDDRVAEAVYDELKVRGVDVADPNTNIVFISEWDTDWGRLIPLTFHAKALQREKGARSSRISSNSDKQPEATLTLKEALDELRKPQRGRIRFHNFAYSKGLDGKIAGDQKPLYRESAGSKTGEKGSEGDWMPAPEGSSQIDAVPRLAKRLDDLQKHLKSAGHGDVKAIGILGTDVYDKLLILRAIRQDFPDVLVFTTELDARYWHPSEDGVANNLIVASSFGLQLQGDLQNLSPPFRHSGQTALFNAALASLVVPPGQSKAGSYKPFELGAPRVFEIGTNGPVDLTPIRKERKGEELHPIVRPPFYPWHLKLMKIGIGVVGLVLSWRLFRRLFPGYRSEDPGRFEELQDVYLIEPDDIVNGLALARCLFGLQRKGMTGGCSDLLQKVRKELPEPKGQLKGLALTAFPNDVEEDFAPDFRTELAQILNAYILKGKDEPGGAAQRRKDLETVCNCCAEFARNRDRTPCLIQSANARHEYFQRRITLTRRFAVGGIIAAALLTVVIYYQHQYAVSGEPFSLSNGVSTWPTDILLLIAILFSLYGITKGRLDLRKNALDVSRHYCLRYPEKMQGCPVPRNAPYARWKQLWWWLNVPPTRDYPQADPKYVDGEEVWKDYVKRSSGANSSRRVLRLTLTYCGFGCVLFLLFGWPARPTRGPVNTWLDGALLVGALLSTAVLTFVVVDASGRMQRFIHFMSKWPVRWPSRTVQRVHRTDGLKENEVREWLDIQVIAARTAAIDRLFYYPFIALALIVVAQSGYFDRFPISIAFVLLCATLVVYAVATMFSLTRSARKARDEAIHQLELKRLNAVGQEKLGLVEAAIEQLQKLNQGAFRKLMHRPIFSAAWLLIAATVVKFMDTTGR